MGDAILLGLSEGAVDALRAALAGHDRAHGVVVRLALPPLRAALDLVRVEHGRIPLGVAARTGPEAIELVELGADEAIALTSFDTAAVLELLDRTRARGILRAQRERERVELAQAEKLTALGTLVAGVAHEVNNPLAALMLGLDALPARLESASDALEAIERAARAGLALGPDELARIAALGRGLGEREEIAEDVAHMRAAAATIHDVVKDLRVLARSDDAEAPQVVRIPDAIEQLLRLIGREIGAVAIVERDYGAGVPEVLVAPSRLTQVLTNVLVNAGHAMREVERDLHRLRISVRADEDAVAIAISDTGPGIPAAAIDRIFDPFFTTKRASLGTGLGLSISRNLMRAMGGDLVVESVYGEGATFVVIVPRAGEAELRAARLRARTIPAGSPDARRTSVLVVDDDPLVLRAYARALGRRHDLLLATDWQEAIDVLSSGSRADVVLADLGLGPDDGARLHRWLAANDPGLAARVVFVATDPEQPCHRPLLDALGDDRIVLAKPTPAALLVDALDRALQR